MNWIDPALLESLEKDYFDDVRVLMLVNCFRSAQSITPEEQTSRGAINAAWTAGYIEGERAALSGKNPQEDV